MEPALHSEVPATHRRVVEERLSLNRRLGLIGLIEEGMRLGSSESPAVADLFDHLWDLVKATVSGSKINPLKPEESQNGFRVFEINSETGENLGRLNMLYLKKPIPCYYLVYVEVAAAFRKKGLGNQILEYFRGFLVEKSALGILDNIIPEDDPTYHIYLKQAWEPVEVFIGDGIFETGAHYMIYVPPGLQGKDLRDPLLKLVHHLKRKRAAIDMRDNEVMVQRTIEELKELYSALLAYFGTEVKKGVYSPLMRFMFTRFVTKLIGFRRRIGDLLGYTGGESLGQIAMSPEVAAMPIKSYAPLDLASEPFSMAGDSSLWARLPQELKDHPARSIESLPNYLRPSLMSWLEKRGRTPGDRLTLGDLMDLGFDCTRLKEISIDGVDYIFERIQARQLPELRKKKAFLEQIASKMPGARAGNAQILVNPPLLAVRDRGNAYVLRRKIGGVHWEEAVEQLQTASSLKGMNDAMKIDRVILATVRKAHNMIAAHLDGEGESVLQLLTWFVSWNLKANQPKLTVDFGGVFLETVWLA
jgi:hypothetical protein